MFNQQKVRKLAELRAMVETLENERSAQIAQLTELLTRICIGVLPVTLAPSLPHERAAHILADHADQLRDLLEPFDSGLRDDPRSGVLG